MAEQTHMAEKIDPAETSRKGILVELTANIVSAYLSKNSVPSPEIADLIGQIHAALKRLSGGEGIAAPLRPAVPIKRSVTPEFIVCLEDGLKFESLKRHLRSRYGISPDQYREKWSLPSDYPMVAPSYAAT